MRLLPAGLQEPSDWEDGLWREKPGFPKLEGSWIHPPPPGHIVPEFEYEEGNPRSRGEPPPSFEIGCGGDCHVRLLGDVLPDRVCRAFKEGRAWHLEAVRTGHVYLGDRPLHAGDRCVLKDGDRFSFARPPTPLAYEVRIADEGNSNIDEQTPRDYPNSYPARFPGRSSVKASPEAPEELRRLAWQTDQMRHRSESDQVRVADWSAFSQHVKRHYYRHGIECVPWATHGRGSPVSPKPPSLPPRPYPAWIAELLTTCQQLPGVDSSREPAFASCLRMSGAEVPTQTGLPGGAPPGPEDAVATSPHSRRPLREWLESVDESLFLVQYHGALAASFDSVEQVRELCFRDGLGPFFEAIGVRKLGHRRLFQKWFRDFG